MKDFKKLSRHDQHSWIDVVDGYLMFCCKLNLISSECNAACWDLVIDKYLTKARKYD